MQPGVDLRDSAYQDFREAAPLSGSLKYAGSLALRTIATVELPLNLVVSAVRGRGLEPAPVDKQDAALISGVLGAAGAVRAGIGATSGQLIAAERGGADLIASRPKILSDASLPSGELAYLQKQFSRKELSIQRAANRGELTFSPGTDSVRIKSLQEAYRADVAARYESMYGKPLDLSRFNADHPVDLIVGGAADQRLRLLNDTINQSVGSSLRQAAKRANLTPGAPINSVTFR
ncbi:MAG: hypothetical protein K2Y20_13275 [Sphingomonas sp.]|nr:hypothetical protein [Sphingomonas sp.]